MVNRHYHNISFATQVCSIINQLLDGRTSLKPTSVQPHHYRTFLAVVDAWSPYVQVQAILSLSRVLTHGDKVVSLWYGSLRTYISICIKYPYRIPNIGLFRWHKACSLGVWNAFEAVDAVRIYTLCLTACQADHFALFLSTGTKQKQAYQQITYCFHNASLILLFQHSYPFQPLADAFFRAGHTAT